MALVRRIAENVWLWPTSADLRVAQSGSADPGSSNLPLMSSAQPLLTQFGHPRVGFAVMELP
jgi:hypothetical protein